MTQLPQNTNVTSRAQLRVEVLLFLTLLFAYITGNITAICADTQVTKGGVKMEFQPCNSSKHMRFQPVKGNDGLRK